MKPEMDRPDLWPAQLALEELLQAGGEVIEAALREDLGRGDPTSEALFEPDTFARAVIVAKEAGVVAGLPVAESVFRRVDPAIRFSARVVDGEWVEPGDVLAEVAGTGRALLAAERTALNFLQRMSGIATRTAAYVDEVATTDAILLDTRKTAPGLRALDKYAVRIGGGMNHRLSLAELAMIKDNHIALAGSITAAVDRLQSVRPELPLEVEARSLDELNEVLGHDRLPGRVLLDNFSEAELTEAVRRVRGRAVLEASGGIGLHNVRSAAETGVDSISVGALTHSPAALDIAMTMEEQRPTRDLQEQVCALKRRLGDRVVILGHHYIRDEVLVHADVVGDSLALARAAIELDAEEIVFCGVRFMGETAAVVARPEQRVYMPVPMAGCYLADCAEMTAVVAAWERLKRELGEEVVPVAYVNSSVELKAFCGRYEGAACTSANAEQVLSWALEQAPHAFFFPDQHLGRNAATFAGVSASEVLVWDRAQPLDNKEIRRARVIVWPGVCNVHQRFRRADVDRVRETDPDVRVIVHPECTPDVVSAADAHGSTRQIIEYVRSASGGATIALGTEARLVHRLQTQHPDKRILNLSEVPSFCRTMTETTLRDLDETLRRIETGKSDSKRIAVEEESARWARLALERMLAL